MNLGFHRVLWLGLSLAIASNSVAQNPAAQPSQTQPPATSPAPSYDPTDITAPPPLRPMQTPPPARDSAPPDTKSQDSTTPPPGNAAQQPEQDSGVFVFHKKVEEVVLHATVVDSQRHLVANLSQPAFSVFEDNKPQPITSFHRDDVPVAMGIVIDNSGSMREKRGKVNEAVLNLLRQSNPGDEAFVVNFNWEPYLDQDFTSNIDQVRSALNKVSMQGSTALYDAIVASSIHLKNNPRIDNKVLLVVTDGRDNASRETLREARARLQEQNGPTLYVIGLMGDDLQQIDRDVLSELAASTGGAAFFPATLDELDGISRTIGRDIHSRYTIGYKSSNPAQDGKYRVIRVAAQAPGYTGLAVRTRKGYYPGEVVK